MPGFWAVDVAGVPPGNTQEYFAAALLVLKLTAAPATIPTLEAGEVIVPEGALVE